MPTISLYSTKGEEKEKVVLPVEIFGIEPHEHVLYEAIKMYLANRRQGTAATKNRALVRGGGRKPWRQKGTGRARHGTIRSPLWVGGGVVFGPHPRNYRYSLPRKVRRKALLSALSALAAEEKIMLLEDFTLKEPKTKMMVEILNNLKIQKEKCLFLVSGRDQNLCLATRNLPNLTVRDVGELNAFEVLNCERLLMTPKSLRRLEGVLFPS